MARWRTRFGLALAALAAPLQTGLAQGVSPDIVRAQAGTWLVAPDDGRPGCRIALEAAATAGGMVARPAPDCAARLPPLAAVVSWSFAEGGVSLDDAARRRVMLFTEDETAFLKTRDDRVPGHVMVQARAGVDRAPHASAIFGAWAMQRPDGPTICAVTFQDKPPPGGEESFALALDPGCDAAVRKLKLGSWRVEDFTLVLYGTDGASLSFEPLSATAFTKAASEGGLPLRLVRTR